MQKHCKHCNIKGIIPEMSGELKQLIGSFDMCHNCAETKRQELVRDLKSSFSQKQMELFTKLQKISRYIELADLHLRAGVS